MDATVVAYRRNSKAIEVLTKTNFRVMVWPWIDVERGNLTYYPLKAGYADTILKYQGAELPHVTVVLDAKIPGAAYTALSRVSYGKDYLIGGVVEAAHFQPVDETWALAKSAQKKMRLAVGTGRPQLRFMIAWNGQRRTGWPNKPQAAAGRRLKAQTRRQKPRKGYVRCGPFASMQAHARQMSDGRISRHNAACRMFCLPRPPRQYLPTPVGRGWPSRPCETSKGRESRHSNCFGFHFLSFLSFGPSFPFILAFELSFLPFGLSFPFILAFWAFISFHFGILGFHFLSFWLFEGWPVLPTHKLQKIARFGEKFKWDLSEDKIHLATFGLVGLRFFSFHFLSFWHFGPSFPFILAFWAFMSVHFFIFGLARGVPPTSSKKRLFFLRNLTTVYQHRDAVHFVLFCLLGLHFLSFWHCGHSFPVILTFRASFPFILACGVPFPFIFAFWAFLSFDFGILGLHFFHFSILSLHVRSFFHLRGWLACEVPPTSSKKRSVFLRNLTTVYQHRDGALNFPNANP